MAAAKTVIKNGVCQGDFDFAGFKALNIDLTDIIELEFGLQDANAFFAGPASGADANPAFRAMVVADLPAAAMLTTQNLAGLSSAATSRTNLGLTTTATASNTATGLQLLAMATPALEGNEFMISDDGVPDWVTGATVLSLIGAEPVLGNPASNGYVLSSTTLGVRSWVAQTAAVLPVVDTTAVVKGSSDPTKLLRIEVDGLTTGTTRVMTVPDYNFTVASLAGLEDFTNKTYNGINIETDTPGFYNLTLNAPLNISGGFIYLIGHASGSTLNLPQEGTLATEAFAQGLLDGIAMSRITEDPVGITMNDNLYVGGSLYFGGAFVLTDTNDVNITTTGDTDITLPESGTLATRENAETLANKTLEAVVALGVKNGTSGFDLNIANSDTTGAADRTLSINLNNADKIFSLTGNLLTVGGFNLTLTLTANTNVTLPTTGTVEARVPVPASAAAAGAAGQVAYDADFEYRCLASGNWVRHAHATW